MPRKKWKKNTHTRTINTYTFSYTIWCGWNELVPNFPRTLPNKQRHAYMCAPKISYQLSTFSCPFSPAHSLYLVRLPPPFGLTLFLSIFFFLYFFLFSMCYYIFIYFSSRIPYILLISSGLLAVTKLHIV